MNRKKKRSLLLICQSPRPLICRSSQLFPRVRVTSAKGTIAEVVPFDTVLFCVVPAGCGFPAVIPYGPNCCSAVTAALPGNAAARAEIPAGVGVILHDVAELWARCNSC